MYNCSVRRGSCFSIDLQLGILPPPTRRPTMPLHDMKKLAFVLRLTNCFRPVFTRLFGSAPFTVLAMFIANFLKEQIISLLSLPDYK